MEIEKFWRENEKKKGRKALRQGEGLRVWEDLEESFLYI